MVRSISVSAQVPGGTGVEGAHQLMRPSTSPGSKWLDPWGARGSWMHASFRSPVSLVGFALRSANDCPRRDPCDFDVLGRLEHAESWVLLAEVRGAVFAERWQWLRTGFGKAATVTDVRVEFHRLPGQQGAMQVGQVSFPLSRWVCRRRLVLWRSALALQC